MPETIAHAVRQKLGVVFRFLGRDKTFGFELHAVHSNKIKNPLQIKIHSNGLNAVWYDPTWISDRQKIIDLIFCQHLINIESNLSLKNLLTW